MSVYTIGNGWTGALGTGSLDSFAAGHNDDDDVLGTATGTASPSHPFKIHDGPVTAAAAGWGHTAFVVDGHVMLCGRPHDFANLLRLKRMPKICRDYVNRYTLKFTSRNTNMNNPHNNQDAPVAGVEPAAISLVEKVIDFLLNDTSSYATNNTTSEQRQSNSMKRNSIFVTPTMIPLPDGHKVGQTTTKHTDLQVVNSKSLCASAGLTAVISEQGHVCTWGVNTFGQCGVGDTATTNVWTPTHVRTLSNQVSDHPNAVSSEPLGHDYPITQVSLGLQHGIALNTKGHVYVWGKADRGQLGLREVGSESIPTATRLEHFRMSQADGSQQWSEGDVTITLVAAGINHSAVRSEDNVVFVFGKNVAAETSELGWRASSRDSLFPISVAGLPPNKQVVDLSCGSHHTAILLEDGSVYAFGLAAHSKTPILEAVEIIPPGIVDMPVRQFQAHFDRTTIVGKNGDQVLEVHLWSEEEDRKLAIFTPAWMDYFAGDIVSVHRGWLHTAIVTNSS